MSGCTLNSAVVCNSKKIKCTSIVIEDPSATSSPSFPAHLRSPSVTLLFSLMAYCNVALEQRCQVYKYNKESGWEFERTRKQLQHFARRFMYIDSVLGRITGSFGLWLHVFSALGAVRWDLQHLCRFIIMFRSWHLHLCRSQVTWCVLLDQSTHLEVLFCSLWNHYGPFTPISVQLRLTRENVGDQAVDWILGLGY